MGASSRGAVLAAIVGNSFLTVIKFVAFYFSRSGAMLSEAIHSLADTGNQSLLYMGIRRSERPPDAMFHYGYGNERFLFALLSAIGIFILGCGVTVYHGIHTLIHPPELSLSWLTFAVLGISLVVDGAVFLSAIRAVAANKGAQSFFAYLRTSSDPTVLAVLFEDAVACAGVIVALLGILMAHFTGSPVYDAISSITIGLMLGAIAIWLAVRNRQLILGQAIPQQMQDAIVEYLRSQPTVASVHNVKSRILASDRYRLKADVRYDPKALLAAHLEWIRSQGEELAGAAEAPDAAEAFALDLTTRVLDGQAREVDRMEAELLERFPELRHLDLESHIDSR